MTTKFCILKVKRWGVSEKFNLQENPMSKSPKEMYLFGEVIDSDEDRMNGFSFQLKIGGIKNKESEATLSEEHIYIGINLPANEIGIIEDQLSLGTINMSFSVGLTFKEKVALHELPKSKDCELSSISKSVSDKSA